MNTKINTLIFSFDRPAQLDLLIKSIIKHDINNIFCLNVLFTYSSQDFKKGYDLLVEKYKNVEFIEENVYNKSKLIIPHFKIYLHNYLLWLVNSRFRFARSSFRDNVIGFINNNKYDNVMFLTDDSLFFCDVNVNLDEISNFLKDEKSSFSFALGSNIQRGKFTKISQYIQSAISSKNENDIWSYAFSVDGRVYNRAYVSKIIRKSIFSNPNTFEAVIVYLNQKHRLFDFVYANLNSNLIGFELNTVQNIYLNKNIGVDQKEINSMYLDGYELHINYDKVVTDFRPLILDVYMEKGQIRKSFI